MRRLHAVELIVQCLDEIGDEGLFYLSRHGTSFPLHPGALPFFAGRCLFVLLCGIIRFTTIENGLPGNNHP